MNKEYWMNKAIEQAKLAQSMDEVPIGCVIVKDDQIIASAFNNRESKQLSTAHAEILAIEKACEVVGSWRLEDCDLYVTLEPCPMCAGAILQSRIRSVYFGAKDPKGGCIGSCMNMYTIRGFNHYPNYEGGILEEPCSLLLKHFFKLKRDLKKQKKASV